MSPILWQFVGPYVLPTLVVLLLAGLLFVLYLAMLLTPGFGGRETLVCPHCGQLTRTGSQTCRACGRSFRDPSRT